MHYAAAPSGATAFGDSAAVDGRAAGGDAAAAAPVEEADRRTGDAEPPAVAGRFPTAAVFAGDASGRTKVDGRALAAGAAGPSLTSGVSSCGLTKTPLFGAALK